jgi:hypothetical protein
MQIPTGLTRTGRLAARAIVRQLSRDGVTQATAERGQGFYTPQEWADRGEEYGRNSVLIVVHDGPTIAPWFNLDYMQMREWEAMLAALQDVGCWAEQCTSWYTAIYTQ